MLRNLIKKAPKETNEKKKQTKRSNKYINPNNTKDRERTNAPVS